MGSYLLAALRRRNEPVRVLARDPATHQDLVRGNIELARGDVTNPSSLDE